MEGIDELYELFRGFSPFSIIFIVPILILISPVGASSEFSVYRMRQYDLHGKSYGSHNALINMEAQAMESFSPSRRCMIAKLQDVSVDICRELLSKGAGAVVIIIPQLSDKLSEDDKALLHDLENGLSGAYTQLPVYFAPETPELLDVYGQIVSATSDNSGSAMQAMLRAAYSNGFHVVVGLTNPKELNEFQMVNLEGKLNGAGIEEQLPTIVIVAHYDSAAMVPALSTGADSNGSGVIALLELARIFSKLYSRSHPKFNILFLLSAGGKLNFHGTKRWIEDQIDTVEMSLLSNAVFVVCLDTLGAGTMINMHVSKPPKEGTPGFQFYQLMVAMAARESGVEPPEMVHKKINLAEELLSWEHERFSIRRLPGFTLSRLDNANSHTRQTITDTKTEVSIDVLSRNIHMIAEVLAHFIFNISAEQETTIVAGSLKVETTLIRAWLNVLTSRARSAELLAADSEVVAMLEGSMKKYLKGVERLPLTADKREPEFVLYDSLTATMNMYSVKPAIFDLLLAIVIGGYLFAIYTFILNFHVVYHYVHRFNPLSGRPKKV